MCSGSLEILQDANIGVEISPEEIADQVFCAVCLPNKYAFGASCFNCPSGCSECEFSVYSLNVSDFV